jgi:hypothetical protein
MFIGYHHLMHNDETNLNSEVEKMLILREEHRLRGFENRVLRKIFGPKMDSRKLHNEELHNLYCSPSAIRIIKSMTMRWAGM